MFHRRKINDSSMEPVDAVIDEEMPYARISPDIPNFEQFPREFGKFIFV